MTDNEYWIKFFKIFTVCFSVAVVSTSGCVIHRDQVKKQLTEISQDPISVMCAYEDLSASGRAVICSIKASN